MNSRKSPKSSRSEKKGLHPRNLHTGRYDFKKLIQGCPDLEIFVTLNPYGDLSVDFSNPLAVRTLNRALLKLFYGLDFWEIPTDFLCPPIPGRADYVHNVADLLSMYNNGVIPRGPQIKALDIGVGASCIFPIIGNCEYGWKFLGSDIDPVAVDSAKLIAKKNIKLSDAIEVRLQPSPEKIFNGLVLPNEEYDIVICNPPFHSSLEEAREGSRRKWKNLGRDTTNEPNQKTISKAPLLNFGGKGTELWCPGGEKFFISRMITESAMFCKQILWFSTLVSKKEVLDEIYGMLEQANVSDFRMVEMSQGQKISRIVAWTFWSESEQESWRIRRWTNN